MAQSDRPPASSRHPNAGRQRLLGEASRFPIRYWPFVPKLAQLWSASEVEVESWLLQAPSPHAWVWTWPGVQSLPVSIARVSPDVDVRLLRFAKGARFPLHAHEGDEFVLVLEGRYTDSTGVTVGAGQLQHMKSGSEHALQVDPAEPCVATTLRGPLRFTGPVLGRLSRWLGR